MLTHRITLPNGTILECFASDEALLQEKFGHLFQSDVMRNEWRTNIRHRANKKTKQARKRQKQARRNSR